MHKAFLAFVFIVTTYVVFPMTQVSANPSPPSQEQNEISITLKNNETVERKVYIYGKIAGVRAVHDEAGSIIPGHLRYINTEKPSTALLPDPVTIPSGETVTVKVPTPQYGEISVNNTDFLVFLIQLDFRIQYYFKWCRQIYPFNNEISRSMTSGEAPFPTEITTTTRTIGQGVSSFGTWFT